MSDTFRELTPAELQHTVLQFLGQNMGELKNLDQHLISKNNTLQGMTLRPGEIMRSVPIPQQHQPQPQPQYQPQPQPTVSLPQLTPVLAPQPPAVIDPNDPVQMEFSFDQSSYAKNIFNSLKEIECILNQQNKKIQSLEEKIEQLTELVSNKKKLEESLS